MPPPDPPTLEAFEPSRPIRPRDRMLIGALAPILSAIIRLIHVTSKIEVIGPEHRDAAVGSERPVIFVIWHGTGASISIARYQMQFPTFITMISRSRDGDIATGFARAFDVLGVRASSSRGGATGLMQFRSILKRGEVQGRPITAFHLLDGPRGPRHRSKRGVMTIARESGALIVPVVTGIARRVVTRSWDRHRIPLPFGRIAFVFGRPIDVATKTPAAPDETPFLSMPDLTADQLDRILADLAQTHPLAARDHALA